MHISYSHTKIIMIPIIDPIGCSFESHCLAYIVQWLPCFRPVLKATHQWLGAVVDIERHNGRIGSVWTITRSISNTTMVDL